MVADTIRFYLDENVSPEVAHQLRKRGIEVITTQELGKLGDADLHHLQRATEMGYVLCTYDMDYLRLAATGISHAGIVFAIQSQHDLGDWVKFLELLALVMTPNEMENHVEYLSD